VHEEYGGVVNRGARDERSSAIRRLQAIMPRHQANAYQASPRVLVGEGRVSFRDPMVDRAYGGPNLPTLLLC
jgi:hypothetical protein